MKSRNLTKPNMHCPVRGCRTTKPHSDDKTVKMLMQNIQEPTTILNWVQICLRQLYESMTDDYNCGRHFGWITRMRQVEELYFRTLYVLFLATEDEIPHALSGERPNSLTTIYDAVNREILLGKGALTAKVSSHFGEVTPMTMLHDGGHASYKTMLYVVAYQGAEEQPQLSSYLRHIESYITRIDHMQKMFAAGQNKETVRQAITKHAAAE